MWAAAIYDHHVLPWVERYFLSTQMTTILSSIRYSTCAVRLLAVSVRIRAPAMWSRHRNSCSERTLRDAAESVSAAVPAADEAS
jgi:hypothetical protein